MSERLGGGSRPATGDRSLLVVIVNYRLAEDIDHLLRQRCFSDARVVLVDNGSQPERIQEIASAHGADVLLLDRNYGFAGAVNQAIARLPAHREILLLNPDVRLTPDAVAGLRQTLTDRRLTGVSPLLRNADGTVQVGTAGGPVSPWAFASYFLFVSHLLPSARGIFYTRRQLAAAITPAWLCMACLLLEGDAFRRFGPIPDHELVYGEDVAWGVRASSAGARFAVVPEIEVVHEQGAAGSGFLWREALSRLALRENGPWGGRLATGCMAVGLAVRSTIRLLAARAPR